MDAGSSGKLSLRAQPFEALKKSPEPVSNAKKPRTETGNLKRETREESCQLPVSAFWFLFASVPLWLQVRHVVSCDGHTHRKARGISGYVKVKVLDAVDEQAATRHTGATRKFRALANLS
jgi:hypothetical protein